MPQENFKSSIYNIYGKVDQGYYVKNVKTESVIEFDSEAEMNRIKKIIQSKYINTELTSDEIECLSKNGFIINEKRSEVEELKHDYFKSYFSKDVLSITLNPTLKCNFKCDYCYETEKGLSWDNDGIEALKKYFKNAMKDYKILKLAFFGGETLLEWKRMASLLDYLNELQKEQEFYLLPSATTNAYLLDEEKIDAMIDKYDFKSFQISLDGDEKSHNNTRKLHSGKGTFDIVLGNLRKLIKKKITTKSEVKIVVRVNLMNTELEEIKKLLGRFTKDERENIIIYFRPIYSSSTFQVDNKNRENLNDFYDLAFAMGYELLKPNMHGPNSYKACEGDSGINQIEIHPDLKVWKCCHDLDYEDSNIGSINENGKLQIKQRLLKNWFKSNPFNDENCLKCIYLPMCWGGCPLNFIKNGKRSCMYEKNLNLSKLILSGVTID